jgi:predicted lipoprotein with Yx(FWY)xxD motif
VYHKPAPLSAVNPSTTSAAPIAMGGAGSGSSAPESVAGTGGSEQGGAGGGGAGGEGGDGARPTITIQKSGFANAYLADANGRTLYVFGADSPGDCANDPITTCYKDCPLSWPVFDAGARVVADGLDDALFGTIERTDGLRQTTYRGWPLYYYKNDSQPGDVRGQAVGRIWHVAEVTLPNVVVARIGTERFLADEFGHALYTYEGDTKGTDGAPPRSACSGGCRANFPPLVLPYLAPVSYLEKSAFAIFVRDDGAIQQSYKGWPLYRSRADERSGDRNGASSPGWSLAVP